LGSNITDLATAASQIEHCFSRAEVLGGVPAAVIALNDLLWDDFKVTFIVIDRAAQGVFLDSGGEGISFSNGLFNIDDRCRHTILLVWFMKRDFNVTRFLLIEKLKVSVRHIVLLLSLQLSNPYISIWNCWE
jgi:hypothetical protein